MTAKTDLNTPQGLELPRAQPDALIRHVNLADMRRIDKDVAPRAKAEKLALPRLPGSAGGRAGSATEAAAA
jgi:hypothetical protein